MTKLSTIALVAVVLLAVSVYAADIRGVKPSDQHSFQGTSIECDGGKKVLISRVNDDFCDCEDGTDEPGTSACPNGRFYCKNAGFRGSFIASSWVGDGVCDCCDGSDETETKCPNTCKAKAAEHKTSMAAEIQTQERGLAARAVMVAQAVADRERYGRLVVEYEEKVASLTALVSDLETAKIKAEDEYETAKAAAEDALRASQVNTKDNSDSEQTVEGDDKVETEEDVLYKEHTNEDTSISTQAEADPTVQPLKQEKEKAVSAWNSAKSDRDSAQRELDKYQKFMALDFGLDMAYHGLYDNTLEFQDNEYTYKLNGFDNVQQTKPGHSSTLGRWKGWDDKEPNVMIYDHGDRCWGAPDRSTRVTLICGEANKIESVKEPNKCEYTMTVRSPAACSAATLEDLKSSSGDS